MQDRRLSAVRSECHNVLSTLRLAHRESAHDRRRFHMEVLLREDPPSLRRVKQLQEALAGGVRAVEELEATQVIEPFLEVLRTPSSSAVVAGVVLGSLNKFTLYGVFSAEAPRVTEAVNAAVRDVAWCRFEATHRLADEVVMIQIMDLLVNLLRSDVGERIADEGVATIVDTCFKMTVDGDLSELLRAAAANQLSHVVLTVFARTAEFQRAAFTTAIAPAPLAPHAPSAVAVAATPTAATGTGYGAPTLIRILHFLASLTDPSMTDTTRAMGLQLVNIALETGATALGTFPEAVAVLQNDLCKFLLQNSQTEDLALFALTLRVVYNLFTALKGHIKVQLEVFLTSIHFRTLDSISAPDEKKELALESLLDFAHDPALMLWLHANYDCDLACSDLFQQLCRLLCRAAVPSNSSTLLGGGHHHHHHQHHPSSSSSSGSSPSAAVVSAAAAGSGSTTMTLSTASLPPATATTLPAQPASLTSLNVLAFEGIFAIVSHVAQRCRPLLPTDITDTTTTTFTTTSTTAEEPMPTTTTRHVDNTEELMQRKTLKRRIGLVATQFNKAPGKQYWMEYGREMGVLNTVPEQDSIKAQAAEVARFLLETPGLDKSAVGEFVSARDDFAEAVLLEYINLIPGLGELRVDDALRSVLEKFRIPGEAQKIERVMDAFATCYFASASASTSVFLSRDAVFIFAFSIVMLHTDAHSTSISDDKRMTLDQFVRNNRGINEGKDLPQDLLADVYSAVRTREIMLTYDPHTTTSSSSSSAAHNGGGGIKSAQSSLDLDEEWRGVLRHSRNVDAPRFISSVDELRAGAHERDMFHILFEPTLHALDTVLENTRDGRVVARCLRLSRDLATIASFFGEQLDLNRLLIVLCRHATLNLGGLTSLSPKYGDALQSLAQAEEDVQSTTQATNALLASVENAAADPRGPVRAFLVARCCFFLATAHGGLVREAWTNLVELLMELARLSAMSVRGAASSSSPGESESAVVAAAAAAAATTTHHHNNLQLVTAASSNGGGGVGFLRLEEKLTSPRGRSPRGSLDDSTASAAAGKLVAVPPPRSRSSSTTTASTTITSGGGGGGLWNVMVSFVFGDGDPDSALSGDAARKRDEERVEAYARAFFRSCGVPHIMFHESRAFSEDSLAHLLSALCEPLQGTSSPLLPPSAALACWESLRAAVIANERRAHLVWPVLDRALKLICKQFHAASANLVSDVVRDLLGMLAADWVDEAMFLSLECLDLVASAAVMMRGNEFDEALLQAVAANHARIQRLDVWRVVYKTLEAWCSPTVRLQVLTLFVQDIEDGGGRDDDALLGNVMPLMDAIASLWMLTKDDSLSLYGLECARGALALVGRLAKVVVVAGPEAPPSSARRVDLFVMILVSLRTWFSSAPASHALIAETLQTVLISSELTQSLSLDAWVTVFTRVLFPMLGGGSGGDQVAASLVAKVFCCHAEMLSPLLAQVVAALLKEGGGAGTGPPPASGEDLSETFRQRLLNLLRVVVDRVRVEDWEEAAKVLDQAAPPELGGSRWREEVGGGM